MQSWAPQAPAFLKSRGPCPSPGSDGFPAPGMELSTRYLRKALLRLFTLMLFSSNISVIAGIDGQEKGPVRAFDFLILMAYLFTAAAGPSDFHYAGLRRKWSGIDTSC